MFRNYWACGRGDDQLSFFVLYYCSSNDKVVPAAFFVVAILVVFVMILWGWPRGYQVAFAGE